MPAVRVAAETASCEEKRGERPCWLIRQACTWYQCNAVMCFVPYSFPSRQRFSTIFTHRVLGHTISMRPHDGGLRSTRPACVPCPHLPHTPAHSHLSSKRMETSHGPVESGRDQMERRVVSRHHADAHRARRSPLFPLTVGRS